MEGLMTPLPKTPLPRVQESPIEVARPQKAQRMLLPNQPLPNMDLSSPIPAASPCPIPANRGKIGNLDQNISKINQAKNVLEEVLNDLDSLGSKALIIDGIQVLDAIMNQLQSPQEIQDQDLKPIDRLVYQMHLDLAKVSNKVDQILEKPSYTEVVQSSSLKKAPHSRSNQPPSPMVVIPLKKDLKQGDYPLVGPNTSPSPSPSPSPRLGQEKGGALRARRLVLKVPLKFLDNLNPKKLRDQINDKFFEEGIDGPVVATIGRSTSNLSLVLTTTETFSGSFLIEKEAIWREIIPYSSISHDAE